MTSAGPSRARRRRRRRAAAAAGAAAGPETAATVSPVPESTAQSGGTADVAAQPGEEATSGEAAPGERRATKHRGRDRVDRAERGLRDLIGAGPSQLGVSGALRGRDVNRPSEQDLAEAERDIVLIRRHWTPPPGKSDGPSASP